ncbi:uncharacterized protein [Musca autumnalis]|uniref:uncharacterized protein n=1 Tax=Musca autumnalis TaxID=221902 RepID=UPI003CF831F0
MATCEDSAGMTLFSKLVDAQRATGDRIETVIRNAKKEPISKRTTSFYKDRLTKLDAAWAEFEITDSKIQCLENYPKDHKYFTEKYYQQVSELTMKYRELFESAMLEPSKESETTADKPPAKKSTINNGGSIASVSSTNSAIRRQNVMIASLNRVLTMDPTASNMKLKERLWEQIQELHFSIWENSCNPLEEGYDMDSYTTLENMVVENFKTTTPTAEKGIEVGQANVLPLLKITIPKFNGDYLKWPAFFDLFTQLVNNQRIPTVQKMWYLKANLTGEAENLISHISATAENYEAAWEILQDRYNNKRVLVASLIHQLIDQPSTGSSAASIKQLHDVTQECLHALKNVGVDTPSWSPILLHLLSKKLDRSIYNQYERSIVNPRELQQVSQLLEFMETRFQSMEAMGQKEKPSSKSCATVASANQGNNICTLSKNGTHKLYHCQNFLKMTPPERLNFTQKQKRCVNCLKAGHSSKQCTARCCMKCNKKHNTLLHLERKQGSTNKQDSRMTLSGETGTKPAGGVAVNTESSNNQEATSLAAANKEQISSYVLLSTAVVKIKVDEAEVECRALLDSGSQVNFITERLPSQFINIEDWSLPKNLTLADPAFNRPDKIDILLGAEHYHELLSIGQIKLAKNLPTMQNTVFGWIISGKIQEEQARNFTCGICTMDESLDASIARLWELEEIKTTNKPMSIKERQCENHFEQHTIKDNKNRFKDPELKKQYVKFMEEYENLGHMTKISADAIRSPHYLIPHHCVQRPESTTTKLRVVFDASAKTSSSHSLNDLMYTGPTVQSDLFSTLLRFRLPKYVFTTDVEKMYRQVLISPEDRQFQLIIWRKDVSQPITYYQLNTVTYGTRAAPYLATKCLQRLAKDNAIRYPLVSQFLQETFYVDDGLGGADSLITAINMQQQLIPVMKDSGFNLLALHAVHQFQRTQPNGMPETDFAEGRQDDVVENLTTSNEYPDSCKTEMDVTPHPTRSEFMKLQRQDDDFWKNEMVEKI